MQTIRRDALRLLGLGIGGSVTSAAFRKAFAAPPTSYLDQYCYCSDILVGVGPEAAINVIATGDNHTLWASSIKKEVAPGVWVGKSIFTNKESIHLRFKVDAKHYVVDYLSGPLDVALKGEAGMGLANWARVIPGKLIGYPEGSSLVALYQTRRKGSDLDGFLTARKLHAAEMYRIKLLAEKGALTTRALPLTGEYLATASEVIAVTPDAVYDFISGPETYGKYTWGRSPRTKVADNTYRCKSDFGGPDLFVKFDGDRERKTVDYYTGPKPDALMLSQSARIFPGPTFGFDAGAALVTFTRWRPAGQSTFDWDFAVANQVNEISMVKSQLENAKG